MDIATPIQIFGLWFCITIAIILAKSEDQLLEGKKLKAAVTFLWVVFGIISFVYLVLV